MEQLDLFRSMDYYPSQQKKKEEQELAPVLINRKDCMNYQVAREEIVRLISKEVTTVCGLYETQRDKSIRWFFNLEDSGFCYIDNSGRLYEQVKGEKKPIYRGKVHKEVFSG